MHKIIHHRNYLLRYFTCFLAVAALSLIVPQWLPWPLRLSVVFSVLTLYVFIRMKRRVIPSVNHTQQVWYLWGWQTVAVLYWLCLSNITQVQLHYASPDAATFALDTLARIPLLALVTTLLAYVTYRYRRPLTLVAFFPVGANALTRLVIFGNTWLRDATTILCVFGFSVGVTYWLGKLPLFGTQHTVIVMLSMLIVIATLKARLLQRLLRRVAKQYGFASTMVLLTTLFMLLLAALHSLAIHWGMPDFQLPAVLKHIDADTVNQCLTLMLIAPLAFKCAPYCRGLSIRQALLVQCFNPMLLAGWFLYAHCPMLHIWLTSDIANSVMATLALAASLYYGNTVWFASMTERCLTDTGHQHQGPLRWFFNQRLQRALLVWLLIIQLGLGCVAIIFLGGIAVGLMIVYSYFYCLFWERLRDEPQCI